MAISASALDGALNGHVYIFIISLILLAVIMAVVGTLGLLSAMGANVTERTREFGVMRAIGGKSGTVMRNIIFEGVFVGLMSWVIGFVLSLPLSAAIDSIVGNMSFRSALPMVLSPAGAFLWLAIIAGGAAAASAYPAGKAAQMTIRETLAYI